MQARVVLLFVVLLSAVSAFAQEPDPPTSYTFNIYAVGASAPQISTPFAASAAQCNQTLTVPLGAQTNPARVVWDDKVNPGKFCVYDTTASGPLLALPSGSYEGALIAANAGGSSAESARDPFSRQRAPAARTGVRVIR